MKRVKSIIIKEIKKPLKSGKRGVFVLIAGISIFSIFLAWGEVVSSEPAARQQKFIPRSIKTIVIDPGHGGKDPGAISKHGLEEKYITLDIARYLKKDLTARGFKVYLTRNRDIYLTLKKRGQIAFRRHADLFISIHVNANRSRRVRGVEVYYLSSRNTQSLYFARMIVSTLKSLGFKTRSPRRAAFVVLEYARTPAVLVETGYLSNSDEENLLKTAYYQKQIAYGIALSVHRLNLHYAERVNLHP